MSAPLAFVDTETTGLDADQHEIWEVGLIVLESKLHVLSAAECERRGLDRADLRAFHGGRGDHYSGEHFWASGPTWVERVWELPVDLGRADPVALQISGYYTRSRWGTTPRREKIARGDVPKFAATFEEKTRGAHLVGMVTSFDEERLRKLLKANGACPGWHYHLVDVENLAIGWLKGQLRQGWKPSLAACPYVEPELPWKSEELSWAIGVEPPSDEDRHTAIGDARWAKRMYEAVMGPLEGETDNG